MLMLLISQSGLFTIMLQWHSLRVEKYLRKRYKYLMFYIVVKVMKLPSQYGDGEYVSKEAK